MAQRPIRLAYNFRPGHVPRYNHADQFTRATTIPAAIRAATRRLLDNDFSWANIFNEYGQLYVSVRRVKGGAIHINYHSK